MSQAAPCCVVYGTSCPGETIQPPPPPPFAPRYTPVWWRGCDESGCPSLECGSQMRRKAEVLLHKNNELRMTKKERYSRAVRLGPKILVPNASGRTQYELQLARIKCSPKPAPAFQAYYSNVPGRLALLYNTNTQLINYRAPIRRMPTATIRVDPRLRRSIPST